MNYDQLKSLKTQYNNIDTIQLKKNVRDVMKKYNISFEELAQILEVSNHTVYSYGKKTSKNKPDLYNLLILASYLNIDINDLFKTEWKIV